MRAVPGWQPVTASDLLEEAQALIEEGSKIIEVQEVELEWLRREVERLRIAAAETRPPDHA